MCQILMTSLVGAYINPFTPDTAKSPKLINFLNLHLGKIEKQTAPEESAAQQLSNE